jgi:GAF domain-containing protein/DNA-binding response OmpR family regulator/anti-sigma regulatory factor (Ser/Thr protein kinase)
MQDKAKTKAQLITDLDDARQRVAELEASQAEHQRARQVQDALYRIADAASAVEDIEKFYAAMHRILGELMYARNFFIALYDDARDMIRFPFYRDEMDEGEDIPDPHAWHEMGRGEAKGLTAYVLRGGEPLLAHREEVEESIRRGEAELLGVPLKTGERTLGVLVVQSYREGVRYSEGDKDLLVFVAQHIATALERARLLEDTRQRNAELTVINSVQRALATELDMQVIYELVGDQIRDLFDAQVVSIAIFDHEAGLEQFRYLIEKGKRYYPELRPLEGVRRHLIRTGQLVLINENYEQAAAKYGMSVIPGTEAPKSLVFVPLVVGETAKGYVSLQNVDREGAFSESDVRLLSTLAGNMSMALENARLFEETNRLLEETEQRAAELAIINSVGQALAQQLDFQAIIDLVGDKIQEVTRAPVVNIALYDRGTNQMQYRYSNDAGRRGEHPEEPRPLDPFRRQVVVSRQPLVINKDFAQRAADYGVPAATYGDAPKSLLFVPITMGDEVAGIVSLQHLEREHAFGDSDLRLLTTITANAGVALENARLFEVEREQAMRQAALFRLSAHIAAALDEDNICRALVDGLQDQALGYPYLAVLLLDEKTGDRVERASIGKAEPGSGRLRLRPGQGLSERPLLDGQLHYTLDVTQAEQYVPALASGAEVDVPIKIGGEVVGVLVVESSEPNAFDQRDFDVLTSAANQAGVALGRVRSLMETRQRAAELATVNRIGQAIGSQLDLDALIELVGEQIRQSFAADIAYVALHDRQTNMIHFPYEYGDQTPSRPFGKGLTERIIKSKESLLINQDIQDRQAELETEKIGIQALSYLGVPIVVGQEAIGVISVQSISQEGRFDEADGNLLSTIAANVGAAIHNARLYQETQRSAEEMAALAEIGNDIAATRDLEPVLERMTARVKELLNVGDIALYLREPDEKTFRAAVVLGQYAEEIKPSPIRLGEGITGRIAQSGVAEFVNYPYQDPRSIHILGAPRDEEVDDDDDDEEEGLMCAPLISRAQVIGLFTVWRSRAVGLFTQAELDFLISVARQAAIAIESARLYLETQRRASQMTALTEVGRDVSATLDLPTVLERIASHARDLLAADSSAVYLAEPGGQTLQAIVALGDIADEIKASPIQLGEGIIGDLAERKAAEVINEVNNDPRAVHIPGTPQISDEKLMAAPLLSGDQASGMMAVWRTESGKLFTEADLRFLEGLARQGAIAIGNAHLYEQAQEAQAAAEEASKAKSTFLANMSHELRTPLNAIIGFTRIVQRRGADILPEKQLENLDKVLASAEHLLELINSILDIAKIEAGRVEVKPTTFDAGALVDMCINTTQPMIVPDQVSLVKDVAPDLPPISSDQDKVKQILLNLLSNAAKFTRTGQITISARRQGETLVVDVTDTGIGILEEDLERIFDEFQQADTSTTREYGGTGLGLSISRHLAQLLDGDLYATSSVGVGSTFTLTIPLRHGIEGGSPSLQLAPKKDEDLRLPPVERGDKSLVLAIDDDPDVIYLLQENLGEAGYQVVGALGGAEGVQKARELQPYAITLDIMMPHKDGWQVLHELKTDVATRDIPIIVLSIVDKKELGYHLGADDYLVKPLDSEAVLAALNRLPRTNGGLPPRRLLVVDDDPRVADMVRQLLDETAYLVEAAEDGVAALEVISQERPDIILLDLMMPRLDGFGVIEQLKQDPRHRRIPIVVLTAKTPSNEETASLQRHVSQVMHKQGLDSEMLIEELQRALSGLASPSLDDHDARGG